MSRGIGIGMLACLIAACARWELTDQPGSSAWRLPQPRLPPDAVVMEVTFARAAPSELDQLESLWQEIDEQRVDTAIRKKLYRNGVRCGILGQKLPPVLERILERQADSTQPNLSDGQDAADDVSATLHRLQLRSGQRSVIQATPTQESLTVLWTDEQTSRGETFTQAQAVFSLSCFPQANGRVRIQLVPEIEYGPARRRHVASDGMWRLEFGRDRKSYNELAVHCELAPGEILVLSSTAEPKGLGKIFFLKDTGHRAVLLLRIAQTQEDVLFTQPSSDAAPEPNLPVK